MLGVVEGRTATGRVVVDGLCVGALVRDVSFTAEPGRVTGLVGPPGSGKTTVLRAVVGLVRPSAGRAGVDVSPAGVGVVLDDPGFHPVRRARDHLRVYAAVTGVPDDRVDEVLALVGLTEVAGIRVGRFPHGPRQRLALATAMLSDPGTLILDQPGLGMDAIGLAWLHQLLADFAGLGRTVLVTAPRLDGIADHQVELRGGRRVPDTREAHAATARVVVVSTPEPARLADALRAAGTPGVEVAPDGSVLVRAGQSLLVAQIADSAGVPITAMDTRRVAR